MIGHNLFVGCRLTPPSLPRRLCDRLVRQLIPALMVAWLFSSSAISTACAQDSAPPTTIDSISIGFNGRYKVGFWTPVTVGLTGGDTGTEGHLEVIVPDGDGVPTKVVSKSLTIPAGQSISHTLCTRFGRPAPEVRVRLTSSDRVVANRTFTGTEVPQALSATQELIVVVGPAPDLDAANRLYFRDDTDKPQVVELDTVADLPESWYAYDGVDLVWLSTSEPEIYNRFAPSDARPAALNEWVRMGGRLVLSAGAGAEAVIAENAPLARFLPGRFEGLAPLRQFSLVENYSESLEPLPLLVNGRRLTLQVPRITEVDGTVEVPGDIPLVIRSNRGFGQITFVGLDLDQEPFQSWRGRGQLINRLLKRPTWTAEAQGSGAGRVSHLGYHDLAGQLRSTLDQFQGVQLVSFVTVGGLIGLYALLIGPVDYFLVRRFWKGRPGWSAVPWITFPAVVVLFSVLAVVLTAQSKGRSLQINQVNLVDIDLTPEVQDQPPILRGQSWLTLYSPTNAEFDLTVEPTLQSLEAQPQQPVQQLISWFGLPGTGIGGMNAGAAEQPLFTDPYRYAADLGRLRDVPVAVWSTKSFHTLWRAAGNVDFEAQLREGRDRREALLSGTITNRLGFPLTECLLIYQEPVIGGNIWAYDLGTIDEGQTLTLGREFDPITLETRLTQRKLDSVNPYDEAGFDAERIMTMMMFHKRAGGPAYTGLLNRYQHRLDFSDQLQAGRAVLVGKGAAAAVVEIDEEPVEPETSLTYYRWMLPVAPAENPQQ